MNTMELKKFNRTNLKEAIKQRLAKENIVLETMYTESLINKSIDRFIISRVEMLQISDKVVFKLEDDYIETEWKDMISLHYINTSYYTHPTVMRVHLFSDKRDISNETYLGFFTLRISNELSILLSYVYPNFCNLKRWKYRENKYEKQYFIAYKKYVHIEGKEFYMYTFPIFAQDGTVASCSHASMLALGKYLHSRFNFPKINLRDINAEYTYDKIKSYPTKGLGYHQIIEVFSKKKIPILSEEIRNKRNKETNQIIVKEEEWNRIRHQVDANIESGLPVVILGEFMISSGENGSYFPIIKHSIMIIGHTLDENKKKYIIYDDSSSLIGKICNSTNILGVLSWEELSKICISAVFLFPQYEKVYFGYEEVRTRLAYKQLGIGANDLVTKTIKEVITEYDKKYPYTRLLLIENTALKELLERSLESGDDIITSNKGELETILQRNLPHYLWYCEASSEAGDYFILLADTTYNNDTAMEIFFNTEAFYIGKQLCLLIEGGKKISENIMRFE